MKLAMLILAGLLGATQLASADDLDDIQPQPEQQQAPQPQRQRCLPLA